jgi:hypothetical protein
MYRISWYLEHDFHSKLVLHVFHIFCLLFILVQPVASIVARALFLVDVISEYPRKGEGLVLWSDLV